MIKINADAAYKPKTQEAGIGLLITSNGETKQFKIHIKHVYDNHLAEFIALYETFQILERNSTETVMTYHTDSKTVIQAIEKQYTKKEAYQPILAEILNYIEERALFFPKWVPEAHNKGADHIARQALHQEGKIDKLLDRHPLDNYSR